MHPSLLLKYKNILPLGTGPLGETWQGTDVANGRHCVIKEIRGTAAERFAIRERLAEQNVHAESLESAGFVPLALEHEDTLGLWLSREYVEGDPLALTLVDHHISQNGANGFMVELSRSLQQLQKFGLTHGHLGLTNIFVQADGSLRLTDLGLCPSPDEVERTKPGHLVLFPPERFDRKTAEMSDDSFSLGVVFFSLIAGLPPLSTTVPEEIRAHVRRGLLPLPVDLFPPDRQDERLLLEALLEVNPEERLIRPSEIRASFEGVADLRAHPTHDSSSPHPSPRKLIWLSVSMLVLIVCWLLYFTR